MYGSETEIFSTALSWLEGGHQVTLITVLKTWGSSPRPVGSLMIIRGDGMHAGSVSGGCVEEELLSRSKNHQLNNETPTTLSFGSSKQEAVQLGLPCGGRLELLIEPLDDTTQLQTILENTRKNVLTMRCVCTDTGESSLRTATTADAFRYRDNTVCNVFGPAWQLLLIGAGHLSQFVTQMALMLDYRISVCDPREEYQQAWPIKDIQVITTMPDDTVKQITNRQRCSVLALTHDPKLDDMALLEALTLDFFYVGALGSVRNNDKRRRRLMELGLTVEQVKKLHGPVGLVIGSHTPAEIAVSILAGITARRNLVDVHPSLAQMTSVA